MKKFFVIVLHFALTVVTWTAWLWLPWRYIALLSLAHIVLLETGDGCFLSHWQFGDRAGANTTFYEWWLGKLGVKIRNRKRLKIFMRFCVPLILVLLGVLVQDGFGFRVLG